MTDPRDPELRAWELLEASERKLKIAIEALEWIDKPDHLEPDKYTQTACFQHRAYNALKAIKEQK